MRKLVTDSGPVVAMAVATAGWDHWRGQPQPTGTLRLTDSHGEPPRLEQASLTQLGVSVSRFAAFPEQSTPHIVRPIDALLAETLTALPDRESGRGQLVVEGERLAGATHALAHALRTALPSWKVAAFADEQQMALSAMLRRAATWVKPGSRVVVWLDAISLAHLAQLTEPLLADLPPQVVIAATVHTEASDRPRSLTGLGEPFGVLAPGRDRRLFLQRVLTCAQRT